MIKADAAREAAIMRVLQAEFDFNDMARSRSPPIGTRPRPINASDSSRPPASAEAHAYASVSPICRPDG